MEQNRWQLNRAGILNFWYYDEEEFNFSDGKLLLRGNNGTGKSVTMQSLIPLLLDGKKSPDRLDPFGSRARKMEDYLLGEKSIVDRDERTGYLFLEYKREGLEQYLTTGMGLRAKRMKSLDFWGFVITDNRRANRDILLYKEEYNGETEKEEKIPLTRNELENRIGEGGKVVQTQREYMELVNRYVFGFESLEAYEELIKLLIQLRSPKLSRDYKPTVIYEILDGSLPALSDEELRPLSDTIENMDQTKQQLQQLQRDQVSIKKLCNKYDEYNRFVLAEKAEALLGVHNDVLKYKRDNKKLQQDLWEHQQLLTEKSELISDLSVEEKVLKEEETALQKHEVFSVEKEKNETERKMESAQKQSEQKEQNLSKKKKDELKLRQNIVEIEEKNEKLNDEILEIVDDMESEAGEAGFTGHGMAAGEFTASYQEAYVFDLWKKEAAEYNERLDNILSTLRAKSRALERYQEADRDLAETRKELDLLVNEERKWSDLFEEEKGKLLTTIYQWQKDNKELTLQENTMQEVSRCCGLLYDEYTYEQVKKPAQEEYHTYSQALQEERAKIRSRIEEKKVSVEDKEKELKEWKAKKEPEPEQHPATIAARKDLVQKKIPHIPFYRAVEFMDHLSEAEKERLEAAIGQMGLLDALIIPEKYLTEVGENDKVIIPQPKFMTHTLADYLHPAQLEKVDISPNDIDKVLSSIVLEEGTDGVATIAEDGSYRLAILRGHAPKQDASIYIGQESRKVYRQQVINSLMEELSVLQIELEELKKEKNVLDTRLELLQEEYGNFPRDKDVREAHQIYRETGEKVKIRRAEVEAKNEKLKKKFEELQSIKSELRRMVEGMIIPCEEEAYDQARYRMKAYLKLLQDLELIYKDYTNNLIRLKQIQESLEDIILDVDEIKGELNVISNEIKQYKLKLAKIEERLQTMGAEEIRAKINQVQKRLEEIAQEIPKCRKEVNALEYEIKDTNKQLVRNEFMQENYNKLYLLWKEVFEIEFNLGLARDSWLSELDGEVAEEELLKIAHQVWQYYGDTKQNMDRDKVSGGLNTMFIKEQGVLVEYRPMQSECGQISVEWQENLEREEDNQLLGFRYKDLIVKSRRMQILLEYEGKRVTPYFVLKQLDNDIELQEIILSEKDRELYEEIIMHSVGRIIRGRINRAEQWVKQIDELMSQRDSSSGLTFSLRWKPLTANREEELDTKELVELLRRDPRLMKEEDMERITRHFRSKINKAREIMEEKGYGETLHQIIKEMLDYRKWFAFTLYYQKSGEPKKELTNNAFYIFSGGEKAMAMYIPLFSAAYSRYMEARKDAPFIISLDEAFAGVDEQNISDMFDLLEKLGFDYIINSQSLWGDYDTVSSLSISELIRPKNAPYVSVVRYLWNGKVRKLLPPQQGVPVAAK